VGSAAFHSLRLPALAIYDFKKFWRHIFAVEMLKDITSHSSFLHFWQQNVANAGCSIQEYSILTPHYLYYYNSRTILLCCWVFLQFRIILSMLCFIVVLLFDQSGFSPN